jgi:hypothetical protein
VGSSRSRSEYVMDTANVRPESTQYIAKSHDVLVPNWRDFGYRQRSTDPDHEVRLNIRRGDLDLCNSDSRFSTTAVLGIQSGIRELHLARSLITWSDVSHPLIMVDGCTLIRSGRRNHL